MNGSPGGWHTGTERAESTQSLVCIETCPNGAVKAESKEFPSKDLLRLSLSYFIYYLPGKQSTLNYIQYIITIPFRHGFSQRRTWKGCLKGLVLLGQEYPQMGPNNKAGRF